MRIPNLIYDMDLKGRESIFTTLLKQHRVGVRNNKRFPDKAKVLKITKIITGAKANILRQVFKSLTKVRLKLKAKYVFN